ncbi:hypothetical protein GCM10010470_08060 [Saccharopolyspora taberi]|uniref:DUF4190 domain-containing protein n=1 Tax=Saccharopolyspora taberi TaxID=60895 RepID=A0ABN3V3Z5_9PSEU
MTSLVLGVVGVVFACFPYVGVIAWPLVLAGLVFGVLGVVRVWKGVATNRATAIGGTALNVLGLLICVGQTVLFVSVYR